MWRDVSHWICLSGVIRLKTEEKEKVVLLCNCCTREAEGQVLNL